MAAPSGIRDGKDVNLFRRHFVMDEVLKVLEDQDSDFSPLHPSLDPPTESGETCEFIDRVDAVENKTPAQP